VKPPPFDYVAPSSVDEAVAQLGNGDGETKVLAGGQSLIPLLSMRLAYPDLLVDLRRIEGLDAIEHDGDRVVVGAMATQREAESSHLLHELCPLVPEALTNVAHPQIRSRGTVGGSVAHGDPAAELPAVIVALDASVRAVGPAGARTIAGGDLYTGMMTTALAEDEVLTGVELPVAPPGSGWGCVEVARRAGDYAMAGAVAQVATDGGSFSDVRLALFGVSGTPARIGNVERELTGSGATPEAIEEATAATADELKLIVDPRVDENYSRHLACVVAKRALTTALERAA
jgi:aerobic carbon-monoxide dehydrogenase medium subunit